ncbi:Fibrinogen-like protein A,Ryncolin-4,Angiopoietin-related protein 7,Ficolin-3,Ficolin-1-B,Techylectin-5A,Ficolin-2,Ryncolin-1,Tenascin-R,Fibrinogen-like protein 1,Angiopoietin-1,Tenascin-X,Fibrinogen C domain-containing protein 1-A,Tenascin-N,Ryncolin-3,Tenascin,Fibroleukin,Fibrinogen C domain-containing protein 1,Techylectin-like protein,Ryncolin-2,Fibrinogen beta chain,Angiopoietin-related protein 6,Techylectin-5B,Angiopoietin-related protein 2,Angiopoietin-2,Microfibril-associated glycoprotein 4,Fibrino|uniref:Fibrinogen C-terminal domain-containing protein n=1 Tax=Mytilus coruscus TaxID=42192 RepID=A0A6J8A080_MYTCO|nr:Fibrinogen-like protein A,Ryncolin-4,Angiopoietin-related protein 7,Ficolin-3,Ficolin-1-B,Techylectin-5A,Ficolin-2,Ryncolin-1,Tenascin-R,Fibrinogen-like protein 1,Angiopoietin-1,Tenascin-X,Fibrinogen C domain-containing protein 1-A,Tenascin-N,Ryncolin-3,Tenascin,Fibroleukin,Fibrinogen C domain-containing protein 1,Techylectin-like protein,Ryncolin-2,Fibrinogen beta chain,Angiopoietin-related protein 6,Techylectin-5B,Angiopoietin-related protein 2,Angiopoietin-2,Microfibril-associated glycoprotei
MHMELLFTAFLLVFVQSYGKEINKEKCAREVADKVANLITETTSQCIVSPSKGFGARASDCGDIRKSENKSGVYTIYPDGTSGFRVFCDMKSFGGGWTLFQRRTNGFVGFYRDWESYKNGFGNLKGDFWLGNEYLNKLTEQGYYILRIDMWDFKYNHRYAIYNNFVVKNELSKYKLEVTGYTGTAGDSFGGHNGYRFSTRDRDNDAYRNNCAEMYKGGWWYSQCHSSNLNGMYLKGTHSTHAIGVNWRHWKGYNYSLKATRMMIRRA